MSFLASAEGHSGCAMMRAQACVITRVQSRAVTLYRMSLYYADVQLTDTDPKFDPNVDAEP